MLKWLLRIVVGFVALVAVLLATGYGYERVSAARDARRFDPPGEMVDVGGFRLNILCKGDAPGPTVVMEAGGSVGAVGYLAVQDEIARFARVCSYDRAGLGWSEPTPLPRSFDAHARELDALLDAALVPGPYVFVAHSWGGGVVRSFVREHRDKVAAVLHRFGVIRLVPGLLGPYANATDEVKARLLRPGTFAAMVAQSEVITTTPVDQGWNGSGMSVGDLPLIVVVRGRPDMGEDPEFERAWLEANRRLSGVSTNSTVMVAQQSGHLVHTDEPAVYVDAVRRVVIAARDGGRVQGGSDAQP